MNGINVADVQKNLSAAQAVLNGQIDAAFKARKMNVIHRLDLASKAIDRAASHLTAALEAEAKKSTTGTEGE